MKNKITAACVAVFLVGSLAIIAWIFQPVPVSGYDILQLVSHTREYPKARAQLTYYLIDGQLYKWQAEAVNDTLNEERRQQQIKSAQEQLQ